MSESEQIYMESEKNFSTEWIVKIILSHSKKTGCGVPN